MFRPWTVVKSHKSEIVWAAEKRIFRSIRVQVKEKLRAWRVGHPVLSFYTISPASWVTKDLRLKREWGCRSVRISSIAKYELLQIISTETKSTVQASTSVYLYFLDFEPQTSNRYLMMQVLALFAYFINLDCFVRHPVLSSAVPWAPLLLARSHLSYSALLRLAGAMASIAHYCFCLHFEPTNRGMLDNSLNFKVTRQASKVHCTPPFNYPKHLGSTFLFQQWHPSAFLESNIRMLFSKWRDNT